MRVFPSMIALLIALVSGSAAGSDQVSIIARLKSATIASDRQPAFCLSFKNLTKDYLNLYNVGAYWKWKIEFVRVMGRSALRQAWQLQFDVAGAYVPIKHEQMAAGSQYVLDVDLNDPSYTFVYAPSLDVKKRVRHLDPGKYLMKVTVSLEPPFADPHEWTGPLETELVKLVVVPAKVETPSKAILAKWNATLDKVLKDKLDPHGLWENGMFAKIELPSTATSDDVISAAVNRNILGSKAYSVNLVRELKDEQRKTAVLMRVGKTEYVLIDYYIANIGWWSRFYEVKIDQ